MSLLTLLRGAVAWSTVPGDTNPTPSDLVPGRDYWGVQIGGRSGKPLILPFRGSCSDMATNDIGVAVQIGRKDSRPLVSAPSSICNHEGDLLPESIVTGLQIGGRQFSKRLTDRRPLVYGKCIRCGDEDPPDPPPDNPTFDLVCCNGVPAVLYANVVDTTSHDTSAILYNWNSSLGGVIPAWWPAWMASMGVLYRYGWYSHLIEDFVCEREFDFEVIRFGTNYHYSGGYTETFYYVVVYAYGCFPYMFQVARRQGSWQQVSTPWGTEFHTIDQAFFVGAMGALPLECYERTCDPFYQSHYIRKQYGIFGDAIPFLVSCPDIYETVDGPNNFLTWVPESIVNEPDATCIVPPYPATGSGPYIEVYEDEESLEEWPPA